MFRLEVGMGDGRMIWMVGDEDEVMGRMNRICEGEEMERRWKGGGMVGGRCLRDGIRLMEDVVDDEVVVEW